MLRACCCRRARQVFLEAARSAARSRARAAAVPHRPGSGWARRSSGAAWPAASWCRPACRRIGPHAFALLRHLVRQQADRLAAFQRLEQHAHARQVGRRQPQLWRARAPSISGFSASLRAGGTARSAGCAAAICLRGDLETAQVRRQEDQCRGRSSSAACDRSQLSIGGSRQHPPRRARTRRKAVPQTLAGFGDGAARRCRCSRRAAGCARRRRR